MAGSNTKCVGVDKAGFLAPAALLPTYGFGRDGTANVSG